MKILVAGGAGFIGSNLVLNLIQLGHEVSVIDNFTTGINYDIKNLCNEFYEEDVCNNNTSKYYKNIDVVFNLVGSTGHAKSINDPLYDINKNVVAPMSVFTHSIIGGVKKIIYTGTRAQYGQIHYLPVNERHPNNFVDINGISKFASEQQQLILAKHHDIRFVSLRIPNVFGERANPNDPDGGVLNWFIKQAILKKPIEIYGKAKDVIHVSECVNALIKSMNYICEYNIRDCFNIGGRKLEFETFIKYISQHTSVEWKKINKTTSLEVGEYLANAQKFKDATKWDLSNNFEELLKNTIKYYKYRFEYGN